MKKINLKLLSLTLAIFALANFAAAQTTAFTYQGRLNDTMSSGSGSYLMKFELYADAAGNTLIDTLNDVPVTVSNNVFTVQLNFTASNAFDGGDRFLKISVKRNAGDVYTPLDPLQPFTSTPYAIKSKTATTADISTNTFNVGGTPAAQIIKEGDTRLTDSRTPTAGSGNYIQNQNTAMQSSANFIISGTGEAASFNARTQFSIGGDRVLSNPGTNNLFAGFRAGNQNLGESNSFFGHQAGLTNRTGNNNSFFGRDAGQSNFGGIENTFIGVNAGLSNTAGGDNTFVGVQAGSANTTGNFNTIIGTTANVNLNNLTYATALGAGAIVGASNTVVLGRSADAVQIPGSSTVGGTLSANSVTSATQYNLGASRILGAFGTDNTVVGLGAGRITTGTDNSFFGTGSGFFNAGGSFNSFFGESTGFNNSSGANNSFFGASSGFSNSSGAGNSFFGSGAGASTQGGGSNVFLGLNAGNINVSGSNNTVIGENANVAAGNLTYTTVIGAGASSFESNSIVLGRNNASDTVRIPGKVKLNTFGSAGTNNLCFNAGFEISNCSSSLRYKTNIAPFAFGLSLINQLQPISFDWKNGGMKDVGFGAEDIAAINPLFVNYNAKGEVEGVKYDRLSVLFVNAFKEQQTQISEQQKQIDEQKALIDGLRKLVCAGNPNAAVCQ